MRYLLDSNAVINFMKGHAVTRAAMRHDPSDIGMSAVVLYELYFGAFKSERIESNIDRLENLAFAILPFEVRDAATAGEIRAGLSRAGTPIAPYDVLIAGQALARDLTLVTHNVREFSRIDGLRVEDWEA